MCICPYSPSIVIVHLILFSLFFFNDTATTEIYTLSLHDALPITLDAGDRPAEQMTVEVTTPAEEAVRAIPGVRSVRSTTSRGTAEISVNSNWREDMVSAILQCQSQVNNILSSLPTGTSFEVA